MAGCLDDISGGELENDVTCLLEVVASSGVLAAVTVGGVAESSADLDDDAGAREVEVDTGDGRPVRSEHDLRLGSRESGSPHELQESTLQI